MNGRYNYTMSRPEEQEIRFCTSQDGVRIAFATVGSGPPLVKAANWLSHLEFDWQSPVWRHWMRDLSRDHTLIRYDSQGCGLSDSNIAEYSLDAWVQDLEAVVDALKLERFPLLGISQGGPIAIAYANRHPKKVSHLILYGTYARGLLHRQSPSAEEERDVLLTLVRVGWGKEHPAFRQVFTSLFLPDGTPEQFHHFNELQRMSSTPENAARMIDAFHHLDVRELTQTVRAPSLVLHARGDLRIPFEEGRLLASLLPRARFVPLESRNHILMEKEFAWIRFLDQVRSFLRNEEGDISSQETSVTLARWVEINQVFEKVVELPEEERESFLDISCANDLELRKEVESLLAQADKTGLSSEIGPYIQQSAASWLSASAGIHPGQTVGNYVILEKIGEGGMGIVFKARDLTLERTVALKLLPDLPGEREKTRLRFLQEAKAAAALDHPNICTIYEIDETPNGLSFISMAYYQGEPLSEKIRRDAPLPSALVLEYAIQTLEGLAHAHEHGVVHRDVKPANIFVTTQGQVKILDFGIAKVAMKTTITQPGMVMGTLAYMSPEQARAEEVDARSDLFSLGGILYEMLSGQQPFAGASQYAQLFAIQDSQPAPLDHLPVNNVPAELKRIIGRALEKDRNLRYQTSADMLADLQRLRRATTETHAPVHQPIRTASHSVRRTIITRVAVAAFLLALVVAGVSLFGRTTQFPATVAPSTKTAVAVLPFINMSADKEQAYFSDGLTEELTDLLAMNPKLRVISQTSAFSFKGKDADIKTIAKKLNVTHVVEGSVRKSGNQLRITAVLIEVGTDSRLWSQTYQRQMENIFAVQDEIAASVAAALKVTLEGNQGSKTYETAPEAYNAYLQGRYFLDRAGRDGLERAEEYYKEALRIDPSFARAWVGLSYVHSRQADVGYVSASEGYEVARNEVEKALQLQPNLAEAYGRLGQIKWSYDLDWFGADAAFQRALQLEPGNAETVRWAARMAGALGNFEKAIQLDREAIEQDPVGAGLYNNLGLHTACVGRWKEAEAALRKALELNPEFWFAHYMIGRIYLAQSRPDEAFAEMQKESEPAFREAGLVIAFEAIGKHKEADAALADYIEKYQGT
ncbi:MAG TPA: alpha/beta fold hydrolase, partial [Acidobacteriota bacterium]|nr:alpha/beta fold hydrolase [Acidobacteriota bacterium]